MIYYKCRDIILIWHADGLRHIQNKESYSQYQRNYYATKVAVSKKVLIFFICIKKWYKNKISQYL